MVVPFAGSLETCDLSFWVAQVRGDFLAMTSNFILNNFPAFAASFTIRRGLLLLYRVCSVGLLANVGACLGSFDRGKIALASFRDCRRPGCSMKL